MSTHAVRGDENLVSRERDERFGCFVDPQAG